MSRLREWGGRLLLAAVSTAVGLAALEASARLVVGRWSSEPGVVGHPFAQFDPDLGWSKPPHARGILRRPEYRVRLELNSFGLRGPEISAEKPPGTRRVLLLGDSFTEGYTVEDAVSVRGCLERSLNAHGPPVFQVVNGGTAGWSTDQEVLFYEKTGRNLSPDLVVLLFYYNDLYRDGGLGIQPWFELDGQDKLVLRNSPVPPHQEHFRGEPFALKPYRGSMALALLQTRLDSHPGVASFLSRLGLAEKPATNREIPEEFQPFGRQRPRQVNAHWDRLQALLSRLDVEVQRDGAALAIFYVPARFEIDDSAWDLTRSAYGLNARWDRDRVVQDLGRVAKELGLPFIDPRSSLRQRERGGSPTYFPMDGHWTEAGNEEATREILSALNRHGLLGPAPPAPAGSRAWSCGLEPT